MLKPRTETEARMQELELLPLFLHLKEKGVIVDQSPPIDSKFVEAEDDYLSRLVPVQLPRPTEAELEAARAHYLAQWNKYADWLCRNFGAVMPHIGRSRP